MSGEPTRPAYGRADLVAFTTALSCACRSRPDKAGTVAEVLVEGDLLGHTTHGLALAAPYPGALEDGSMARAGGAFDPIRP